MVRIRLRRVGRKKQPSYRVVVADSRSPRDGRYIEIIGFYNPRTQPSTMTIDEARALHWLQQGAQPSDAVRRILDKLGTLGRFDRLKKGEDIEALVAEAEQQAAERTDVSPRTSYPAHEIAQMKGKPAQAAQAAAAEVAEESEAVEETEDEEEAAIAAEAEAEVEADAEVEETEEEAEEETEEEAAPAEDEAEESSEESDEEEEPKNAAAE